MAFLDVSAIESAHLSPEFSFYLISIANATSTIGRVGGGVLSDKFGCLNVLIPSDIIVAAVTIVWPHCMTKVGLINVAVFYGLAYGSSVGLFGAAVADLGDPTDVGRRTVCHVSVLESYFTCIPLWLGMLYTIASVSALIGPPISGAIYHKSGGFQGVGIFAVDS
ncbi:hypothetical protein FRB99_007786 [Tulasnella sp. 403]|nr:hypothetical protein FRB99_007786 [Tulasnella sp. 403]